MNKKNSSDYIVDEISHAKIDCKTFKALNLKKVLIESRVLIVSSPREYNALWRKIWIKKLEKQW